MEKKDLRAFVRAKKRAMTPAQVEAASARLAQQLFRAPGLSGREEPVRLSVLQSGGAHGGHSAPGAAGRQARSCAEGVWR